MVKGNWGMDLAIITVKQVFELFLLMMAGVVFYKRKVIQEEGKYVLSEFLLNFVVPAMIINSYMVKFDTKMLTNLGSAFGYSIILNVLGIIITLVLTVPMKSDEKGLFRFACSFSNAAYMGFPLIRALFGEEGILYASVYVTVFNILLWTIGYTFVSKQKQMDIRELIKKIVTCPPIISVVIGLIIYLCQIPIPELIQEPVGMIGDMNTPISMIITGITIAGSNPLRLVKNKKIWKIVLIRMFLIPAISFGVMYVIQAHGMIAMVTLVLEACPTAAITTLLAIKFQHDEELAVGSVVFTTLISIITLPLYTLLLGLINW